jgi:hypothetical protein
MMTRHDGKALVLMDDDSSGGWRGRQLSAWRCTEEEEQGEPR